MRCGDGDIAADAAYVPGSDQPASLTAAAGQYAGVSGHVNGKRVASFGLDASGKILGGNDLCGFSGTATPRASTSAFDWTMRSNGDCIFGAGPITGVMYYDEATRQVHGFARFADDLDQFYLIGTKQ